MSSRASFDWPSLKATPFAYNVADLAMSFLLCHERQLHAAEIVEGTPLVSLRSTFAVSSAHSMQFLDNYLESHREWTREDGMAVFEELSSECTTLTAWLDAVLMLCDVDILLDTDEPYVGVRNTAGWTAVTSVLDPEAVVSFLVAKADRAPAHETGLPPKSLVPKLSDRSLQAILSTGFSDYHVHMGGIRSAQGMWRDLVSRRLPYSRVRKYSKGELRSLSAAQRADRIKESADLKGLIDELHDPTTPLGEYGMDRRLPSSSNAARIAYQIDGERRMLLNAWRALLSAAKANGVKDRSALLEHQLDRYLFRKHQFLAFHRQSDRTNPGLLAFRRHYHSTEPIWPVGKLQPVRYERSPRVVGNALAEYAAHIAQSKNLERIELRLGPFGQALEYHHFFQAWKLVEEDFALSSAPTEIGFAIHFKRSLDKPKRRKPGGILTLPPSEEPPGSLAAWQIQQFLRGLDRDSAVLHGYRSEKRWRSHSRRIVRIDFAGAERDVPVSLASFCMKLVRSDRHALEELKSGSLHPTLHRYWLRLARRGLASAILEVPVLGQSCHAGEDFAHPIEGMYAVAAAMDSLDMREGDTIGHGLSLGWDLDKFDKIRSPRTLTTRGHQFDALFWFYRELRAVRGQYPVEGAKSLEDWLVNEYERIYPSVGGGLLSIQSIDFERGRGVSHALTRDTSVVEHARWCEVMDSKKNGTCAKRAERVPLCPILYELRPQLAALQARLLSRLSERGIVLEFNPSSNLRVSGTTAGEPVPFIAIMKALRANVLATINSDDPGVFGTRIENEYAIAFSSLMASGFTRKEALDVIERIRDVGRRFVYWPLQSQP